MIFWWSVALAFVLSLLGTFIACKWAIGTGLVDIPNARSAHSTPTPRGGGAAIVISTYTILVPFAALGYLQSSFVLAVMGGLAVAVVGYIDDRRQLSPWVRLNVHIGAAIWAVAWVGGMPAIQLGEVTVSLGWIGGLLGVIGVVWTLNLFNFMDGIDGIAASESAFVCLAGAIIGSQFGRLDQVTISAAILGVSSLGFLVWNWPPARIFMGDVGSGYLGFTIAVLAVAQGHENVAAIWVWLILGGVFVVDATITFLRRSIRRERVYEAHRSHAYQRLARRCGSHRKVTVIVMAVNLLWLFPNAWLAASYPNSAIWLLFAALTPISVAVVVLGAGQGEVSTDKERARPVSR